MPRVCRLDQCRWQVWGWFLAGFACAANAAAATLHEQIDALIQQKADAAGTANSAAANATDDEFLRRAYLDLTGTIPAAAEVRQFLADAAAEKRTALIDRLLAAPQFARRMQEFFSVMLLERRAGTDVTPVQWDEYLRASFAANKPLDQLAREILAADSADPQLQPALKFYLDRLPAGYDLVVRDVGRLFLGRDLQCAQCHDHPLVADYKQVHYHGLLAYVNRSFLHKNPQNGLLYLAEKPDGAKIEFQSVFVQGVTLATGPRLLDSAELELPKFEAGQELAEPAADGKPAVPKFRPRSLLAAELASGANADFRRNMANRLWYLMMGRGLVHPLDLHHRGNPPSHPELLDLLGSKLAAMHFDLKAFLRELALSQTYQRSSRLPEVQPAAPAESFLVANMKRLSAEQLAWSMMTATGSLEAVLAASPPPAAGAAAPTPLDDAFKRFRAAFANPPGEAEVEFTPSLASALFIENNDLVAGWLAAKPGNLVDRLSQLPEPATAADELYLSVLTRLPSDAERADVSAFLTERQADRPSALAELAWSLLASTEFCVNH